VVKRLGGVAAALMLSGCAASGPDLPPGPSDRSGGFLLRSVTLDERTMPYIMYVPRAYAADTSDARWPVIVFLHGSGECGTDGLRQLSQGLGQAIQRQPERWPFVVLLPQLPSRDMQWSAYDDLVMAMLGSARAELRLDDDRTYLTGLSRGGAGTWSIGAAHPGTWAALAPICGYGDPEASAPLLSRMPVWCFHGDADDIVPAAQSVAMVEAIRAAARAKGEADLTRLSIYPGVNHGSWDRAYAEDELPGWLLAQRRR